MGQVHCKHKSVIKATLDITDAYKTERMLCSTRHLLMQFCYSFGRLYVLVGCWLAEVLLLITPFSEIKNGTSQVICAVCNLLPEQVAPVLMASAQRWCNLQVHSAHEHSCCYVGYVLLAGKLSTPLLHLSLT